VPTHHLPNFWKSRRQASLYYAVQSIFIKYAVANHIPWKKFPNEYTDVIFIQIDQHLKKLLPKYKGVPILLNTVYIYTQIHQTYTLIHTHKAPFHGLIFIQIWWPWKGPSAVIYEWHRCTMMALWTLLQYLRIPCSLKWIPPSGSSSISQSTMFVISILY